MDSSAPSLMDLTSPFGERAFPIPILAEVSDDDGIASVRVTYMDLAGNQASASLDRLSGDSFSGEIPAQISEGVVQYRLRATDALGRVMVLPSFSDWSEVTVLDTTPPAVVGFGPQGNLVPVDTTIALDFSEQMDLGTIQSALSISPAAAIGPPVVEGTAIRFGLADLQYQTTYTVALASTARDLYGNPLDGDGDGLPGGDFQWSFGTVERPTPPILMAIAPSTAEIGRPIQVQADVRDEDGVARVNLTYEDVRGRSHEIPMTFLGSEGKRQIWLAQIPAQPEPGTVNFRVSAWDTKGAAALYPLQGSMSVQILTSAPSGIPDWAIWVSVIGVVVAAAGFAYYVLVWRRNAGRGRT